MDCGYRSVVGWSVGEATGPGGSPPGPLILPTENFSAIEVLAVSCVMTLISTRRF